MVQRVSMKMSSVTGSAMQVFIPSILLYYLTPALADGSVALTSTLESRTAFDEQRVVFTCIANATRILSWSSPEHIGENGNVLQIVLGAEEIVISSEYPDTIARRVSNANGSGLKSELRITASMKNTNATVTCSNWGDGTSSNITFSTVKPEFAYTCPTHTSVVITPGATTIVSPPNNTGNSESCEIGFKSYTAVSCLIITILAATVIWYIRDKHCKKLSIIHLCKKQEVQCLTDRLADEITKQKKKKRKKFKGQNGTAAAMRIKATI